jgi:hypothetical protein
VHEDVTVARQPRPDLEAMKTLMDPAPFEAARSAAAAALLTPVVPVPAVDVGGSSVPTLLLAKTLNDPDAEARAQAIRDSVLGSAPTAPAAPKQNLAKTMMMGGDASATPPAAKQPEAQGAPAASSDRPTATHDDATAHGRADPSPLSRSVLSPQAWLPPNEGAPSGAGVEVNRVVSLGPPEAAAAVAPAATAPVPATAPARAGNPAARTMLGMPASDLKLPPANVGGSAGPLGGTVPLGGPQAESAAPAAQQHVQKTMLGVAIPGIAPTHGAGAPPQGAPPPQGGPAPVDLRSKQSTMLGVAIPGIAPSHGAGGGRGGTAQLPQAHQPAPMPMPSQVQNTALGAMAPPELKIVPRPRTLIDEPLPAAPQIPEKKGVPALAVVGIITVLVVLLGGVGVYVATRGGGTLTAVPQLDENGRESLKIGCPTCPDGTTIALGASSATVTASAAVLPLPAPLSIGDNDLTVKIDRPAGARDEDVKIHVPVAYRVRADLSTLSTRPPTITVRVEATPGSTVSVEEKPVTLDATGRGAHAIDLSEETRGTGGSKTFERKIPFSITPKGGTLESGQLTARTAIVALALDAPGTELITDKTSAAVAGQTRPGATVTIDGQGVAVDAEGRFGVRLELPAGEKQLELVASAPPLAPRIAKVKITRVPSLEAASKGEDAQNPVGYDVFGAAPASKLGERAMVEGEVVEARVTAGHTVLIVDDKKTCAKGATCLVRVVHGDEDKAARGDTVRVYGRVRGAVTASGKTMPDLEASLVLPLKAARK